MNRNVDPPSRRPDGRPNLVIIQGGLTESAEPETLNQPPNWESVSDLADTLAAGANDFLRDFKAIIGKPIGSSVGPDPMEDLTSRKVLTAMTLLANLGFGVAKGRRAEAVIADKFDVSNSRWQGNHNEVKKRQTRAVQVSSSLDFLQELFSQTGGLDGGRKFMAQHAGPLWRREEGVAFVLNRLGAPAFHLLAELEHTSLDRELSAPDPARAVQDYITFLQQSISFIAGVHWQQPQSKINKAWKSYADIWENRNAAGWWWVPSKFK
jgi:hypothetical protein